MGKPTGLGKLAQATMNFIQKVAMARKYGKNATTKNNVFKLVEALLALADGEIAVPGDKLKATFNVEWVKEDELLVSGKIQQKRNNKTQTVDKGITKDDLWALVECFGKALELSQPKDEKNVDNAQRRGDAIQDVLDCLKDLDILVLKPSARNQGFWKFSLNLKHQTAEKKDNLEVIEEKWKIKIGSVTVEISHETAKPQEEPINWEEICRHNLALQKELTTNLFTNACGMTPQLDGVYVPLAIVERQKPKPQPRNQHEEKEKEKETEKLIPIAEERFFEDVLRQGKSEISQGRKIAIIGEPGAGKTTRLQKIADWILEQELGLPIWIDLAELGEQDICQYLEKVWLSRCQGEVTRRDLEPQMSRVWLLLDGVDEMTHTQGMQKLGKDLLRTWVQDSRVVVTCRVNVWEADRNAFSGFDVFRNLQFNSEQVTEYIRRWFAGMGDAATGESLELALAESENSRLKELIQNPLRLWMLCQIWQTGGGLPETQAGLYGQFVDWVYDWKADEEILDQREAIDKALARLALAAMEQNDEVSRLRLRESWVLKVLGSRPIFQAVMKLGWLNRVERLPEAICGFYHATFQEYFAACAINNGNFFFKHIHPNSWKGFEKYSYRIFDPQWKQVFLLWMGRKDINKTYKEALIKDLVNFDDSCGGFYGYRSFLIAASGIAEFKECSIADDIVLWLIQLSFGQCFKFGENRGINLNYGFSCTLEKQNLQHWVFWFAIREAAVETLKQTDKNRVVSILCIEIEYLLIMKKALFYLDTKHSSQVFENQAGLLIFQQEIQLALESFTDFQNIIESWQLNNEQLEFIIDWNFQLLENNLCTKLEILEKVDLVNFKSILTQIDFFPVTDDDELQIRFARILRQVDILSNIAKNSHKHTHRFQAAYSLAQINYSGTLDLELTEYLQNQQGSDKENWLFGNIAMTYVDSTYFDQKMKSSLLSYKKIFMEIFDPKLFKGHWFTCMSMVEIFLNFAPNLDINKSEIVQKMFEVLSSPINQENVMDFWEFCPRLNAFVWYCAKSMSYQEFYQAWHRKIPTLEPINLAQLPQLLQTQLTETNLHQTLQLLCIDGSKFIDSDNPATDIYLQLVKKHHCPKSTEGTPRTLAELKIYWQLLDWDKHPILIFYEDPTSPATRGFSPIFLDALTRFDGTICLITDTPHPPLQTFSPHDPDLLQTIVNWLKRVHFES
ncbi:NACHT domain-containing protein [Microcoleus sp. S36b_A3]|uniref:NACHT C-terminal alpha/beta 1 domain-containing protein n=1 Tax=unclassified Microcoleus TaxID=2642155 RepID=UPI002FD520F1